MTTPRPPSFLTRAGHSREARPARFGVVAGAAHHGPPGDAPAAPSAEDLAARAESLARVGQAVEVLRLHSARLAEQARSDALEVAFEVARRILESEVRADPAAVIGLVRSALDRARASRSITVRVHPEDVQAVTAAAETGDLGGGVARIEIAQDPSLSRGDVLVDTDFGRVDGRLRTRLDELERAARVAEEGAA